MKRDPVQFKIGVLMFLAVLLLSAAGYLLYRNISSIVSSIHMDSEPDLRLLTIREISMDLEKAENSIRLYTLTNDSLDLRPYMSVIRHINDNTQKLRDDCANDSLLLRQTDTIGRLIRQNIIIWDEMLNLTNSDKISKDIKHLSDSLNLASANALLPEKGLFTKNEKRQYKSPINEVELISNLTKIEQQDRITKEKLMTRETQLAATGSQIREKFYDLISKMENEVTQRINQKAIEANNLAEKTYRQLAVFAATVTLLAITVMFVIARYARKNHTYQVALEKSKNEVELLAKTKELFLANMSHEIRTPVTAISGFTEQLLHENLDDHTLHSLRIIKSSSDHLSDIINDILDFSKLQNNKLTLENVHFSLSKVLEDAWVLFDRQARHNGTTLSYSLSPDTPHALLGDPYRLKQILINLISNAVKFTSNGKVHFSVKTVSSKNDRVELILEVIDTGIGIDEDKLESIFDDFTQAEMSTTRKYGGTGLGLSIVKKLVELHHGTIECRSKKNVGTHITCRLSYQPGDEKQIKSEVAPPPEIPEELTKLRILIVDDEEYNRLLFKTILTRWNVRYSEAATGDEAVEKVRNEKFDLVFMDARMPGMDGLSATTIIRQELKLSGSDLPVICISAASLNDDLVKYEEAGMNAFLEKPFTEEMLLATILSVVNNEYTAPLAEEKQVNLPDEAVDGKINIQSLLHISGGDAQFTKQMLVTFIDTTTRGMEEMKEAASSDQWERVAEIAHKLLPPSRHVGAGTLTDLLKQIEDGCRNNSEPRTLESLLENSTGEYEVIRDLINGQIAKIS
jgi:signal transduction histidine kinase/DNA-binding NarL/FixJ family response regulator